MTHGKLPPQLEAVWDAAVEKDANEHGDEEHSHDYYIDMLKTVGNKQVNQERIQAAFEQRKKVFFKFTTKFNPFLTLFSTRIRWKPAAAALRRKVCVSQN